MEITPEVSRPKSKKVSPLTSPRFSLTRLEEKEELQNLNDRFVVYIERMRHLEEANSSLNAEVASWKKKERHEFSEIKILYENELDNARNLLDEISKEKSRLELENNRNSTLANDLQKKLDDEKQARKKAEEKLTGLDRKFHEKEARLSNLQSEHSSLRELFDNLTKDNKHLQESLESTQYDLERRTLDKVDLENRIQTLMEDLDFRKRTHEQEVTEIKTKVESAETIKVVMETDFREKYDTIIKSKLQELRDEFEEEADTFKNDVEAAYQNKLDDLKQILDKNKEETCRHLVIIRDFRSSNETLKLERNSLETEVNSLKKRLDNLEDLRLRERDDFTKQLEDKDDEINDLNNKIKEMEKEYETLMGIKVALDLEISAYRKLLEGEEERLNIIPDITPRRKRPRTESNTPEHPVLSTSKGNVKISECDASGKFVKLTNTGAVEEPLGGWVVRRSTGSQDPIEYKFNPRGILKAGASVTVWSASSGTKHKPPTDLVMKTADWGPGPDAITTVHNSEGDVVAQMTETCPIDFSKPTRRKRRADKNESCVIS